MTPDEALAAQMLADDARLLAWQAERGAIQAQALAARLARHARQAQAVATPLADPWFCNRAAACDPEQPCSLAAGHAGDHCHGRHDATARHR